MQGRTCSQFMLGIPSLWIPLPTAAYQDYSHMIVAVRNVPSLNIVNGQRCIFSTIDCEAQPPRIDAVCGDRGEVAIREPDWPGFERRSQED